MRSNPLPTSTRAVVRQNSAILNFVHVTLLQASPHAYHFKCILSFGEGPRADFAREQKEKDYDRVEQIARKLCSSYGCRGDLAPATARSAVDLGLNIRILTALIFVESTCRTNAVSSKDAVGPTQVNWRVWRQYTRQQLLDPETNVRAGSKILAGYVRRYGLREGLHAYNGFGDPTSAYAEKGLLVAGDRIQWVGKVNRSLRAQIKGRL